MPTINDTAMAAAPRVALITGAARRVGAHLARTLHAKGYNVAIHYRQSQAAAAALKALLEQGRPGSVILIQSDLLNTSANKELVEKAAAQWGRLDALINNASSFYPTPLGEISESQWNDLVGTNFKAPLFISQAATPYLKDTAGSIVNIVDIHADRPLKTYPVYCAAKAGLVMLTKSLARELAPHVRVNAVAPGTILWPEGGIDDTRKKSIVSRTALNRQGTPEDVAKAVLFLLQDADYMTGQVITVDGGRTLSN